MAVEEPDQFNGDFAGPARQPRRLTPFIVIMAVGLILLLVLLGLSY